LHKKKITESLSKDRQFKWSDRSYWDDLLKNLPAGFQDVVLYDQDDNAIETARCNLYLYDSNRDVVLTPKLEVGCLNGVLRRALLAEGAVDLPQLGYKKIIEENIKMSSLKQAPHLYIGNAVRGLLKAQVNT
jgi:branched-subunit amino acid aminotransferase/4-amino-4-deoxychorismate lyase